MAMNPNNNIVMNNLGPGAGANVGLGAGANNNNNNNINLGHVGELDAPFAQAAIDKANGDYYDMLETLCQVKADIDNLEEFGNEGALKAEMEEAFLEKLDELFGAAGGRRQKSKKSRKHRKSRKAGRKARKTRHR